ncbi:1-deoxy-D-xylulose-5-phosphate reductoisomerase [Agarilytica rhodophyticola]|uniref:1-deoxy-D-xylulose-5-phosphate reductoisomerase n=1 Tax=Agarilytica rhodophyticola TaxID=1737490 RepID=UPI000B345FEF|nr:1-deoxy-D-xylulose-5-phosphate reductoisomerase [Agarilytica rhodophyticola]
MQNITILGATGSIGKSTLAVLEHHREQFSVYALTAKTNVTVLAQQCLEFSPRYAVVADQQSAEQLNTLLVGRESSTEVLVGTNAYEEVAAASEVDIVMAAIVGAAGLSPTLAAAKAGKKVLLANKEALVMSGSLFKAEIERSGGQLLPIDSEHNAIFQCLPEDFTSIEAAGISKILLTGSGGPFRTTDLAMFSRITPEQACAHPNWSMGRKISVDSATMMNKGLEFIEACWLFNGDASVIDIVVHPQSIIHSMVQYTDGSVIAQMGNPDMRIPIAHCLAWPKRMNSGVEALDFTKAGALTFESPDFKRFPCLRLAIDTFKAGKDYAVALNAANEVAVDMFLDKRIQFPDIYRLISSVLEIWQAVEPDSISAVIDADVKARSEAYRLAELL